MTKRGLLTEVEFGDAAKAIGCEVAAIKAFAEVEAGPHGAWIGNTGHPMILVERHVFSRLTLGRFDSVDPGISSPIRGGYGRVSQQPARLERARVLDAHAAIMATSWGLFQILGTNHRRCGFLDPETFEASMREGVAEHLYAFVEFINGGPRLRKAIVDRDWWTAARLYNGPAHAEHNYAGRLGAAYLKFKGDSK